MKGPATPAGELMDVHSGAIWLVPERLCAVASCRLSREDHAAFPSAGMKDRAVQQLGFLWHPQAPWCPWPFPLLFHVRFLNLLVTGPRTCHCRTRHCGILSDFNQRSLRHRRCRRDCLTFPWRRSWDPRVYQGRNILLPKDEETRRGIWVNRPWAASPSSLFLTHILWSCHIFPHDFPLFLRSTIKTGRFNSYFLRASFPYEGSYVTWKLYQINEYAFLLVICLSPQKPSSRIGRKNIPPL